MSSLLVHATAVARGDAAVLLRGAPGAGKSDLALRLIDRGWRLISDDQTEIRLENGAVVAAAPETIAGQIEVRGLGVRRLPEAGTLPLRLVIDLLPRAELERLPECSAMEFHGCPVRTMACDPFDASAPIKVEMGLEDALLPADGESGPEANADRTARGPSSSKESDPAVVLVSGLSGAGHSTTLNILEDAGYEAIDNLPLDLLSTLLAGHGLDRKLAIGVDARTRHFSADSFLRQLDHLEKVTGLRPTLLFLDCGNDVLVNRYMETRRRHPLAADGRPLVDGIQAERPLMDPLKAHADLVVDTTSLTPTALRQVLAARLGFAEQPGMVTFVTSFSYREGLPRAADFVFDVRFLANPHYEAGLRPLSGRDVAVVRFIEKDPAFAPFIEAVESLLKSAMGLFEKQGKSYFTVAIGCTGGRHRSVAVAERLGRSLGAGAGTVTVLHRDIDRDPRRRDEKLSDDSEADSG
jgi:RNase adaptor protein for sRNA GlmZ degradation